MSPRISFFSLTSSSVTNVKAEANGISSTGVYARYGDYDTFSNINASFVGDSGIGVYFDSISSSPVENVSAFADGTSSMGIYISNVDSNSFSNLNGSEIGDGGMGIFLNTVTSSSVTNLNAEVIDVAADSGSEGIVVSNGNGDTFSNLNGSETGDSGGRHLSLFAYIEFGDERLCRGEWSWFDRDLRPLRKWQLVQQPECL